MLQRKQPELHISEKEALCVEIAALCHDLGAYCDSHACMQHNNIMAI